MKARRDGRAAVLFDVVSHRQVTTTIHGLADFGSADGRHATPTVESLLAPKNADNRIDDVFVLWRLGSGRALIRQIHPAPEIGANPKRAAPSCRCLQCNPFLRRR